MSSLSIDAIKRLGRATNASAIRFKIATAFPETPAIWYPGEKAKSLTVEQEKSLAGLNLSDLLGLLMHAVDTRNTIPTTTFNASENMVKLGYNFEYTREISAEDKVHVPEKSLNGVEFNFKNPEGYYIFRSMDKPIFMPVEGMLLNTNYFKHSKLTKPIFSREVATAVQLLASLFYFKNGKALPILAQETFQILLGLDTIISPSYNQLIGLVSSKLTKWVVEGPSSKKGWENTTAHGQAFAHMLYMAVDRMRMNDPTFLLEIEEICNNIIPPFLPRGSKDGKLVKWISLSGTVFSTHGVAGKMPRVLQGKRVDIAGKDVGLDQAWVALELARKFRGENRAEKGVMSRVSYMGAGIHSSAAEACYLASNIARYMKDIDSLMVIEGKKPTNEIIALLHALAMIGFKGIIALPMECGVKSYLKPILKFNPRHLSGLSDEQFMFGTFDFTVIFAHTITLAAPGNYLSQRKGVLEGTGDGAIYVPYWKPGKRTLIYDIRKMSTSGDKNDYLKFDLYVTNMIAERIEEWKSWECRVLSRCAIVNGVIDMLNEYLHLNSGVEIHSLIGWLSYGVAPFGEDPWWYNMAFPKQVKEMASCSVVANVARCIRPLTGYTPMAYMHAYKFKLPGLYKSGLAKLGVSVVAFDDIEIQQMMSASPAALQVMFTEASYATKMLIAQVPGLMDKVGGISSEGSSNMEATEVFDDEPLFDNSATGKDS
jgi:hypothetical protein